MSKNKIIGVEQLQPVLKFTDAPEIYALVTGIPADKIKHVAKLVKDDA